MLKTTVKKSIIACTMISLLTLTACQMKDAASVPASTGGGNSTPASGTKTVTLSVMSSDRFLELAKQKFEQAHPDTKIDIKESIAAPAQQGKGTTVMMTKPDPKNSKKYIDDVNTELMSGKASDIIVMDNLPFKKYADKQLLENIGKLMSQDSSFNPNDYYTNIFDAMKYKGNLYTIPVKVGLNMFLGNQTIVGNQKIDDNKWTWEDFVKLAKSLMVDKNNDGDPDVFPLDYIDPAQLMTAMLNSSFSKFVDSSVKQAKFDSPAFINLLKQAKSMYDDKIIPAQKGDSSISMFQGNANILMPAMMYMAQQNTFDGKSAYYNIPSENDTRGTSFTTGMQFALNSKSANKQEAWEFVKFLLSADMQSTMELGGFPVNKQGEKAQEQSLLDMGKDTGGKKMMIQMNGKQITPKPAEQKDLDRIEQALNGIKVYAESDPKITDIVTAETAPFFQGQKSAEVVAKVIQNKISTYLQE